MGARGPQPLTEDRASRILAELISRELHVAVDPASLKAFVRANWWVVSLCAHSMAPERERNPR